MTILPELRRELLQAAIRLDELPAAVPRQPASSPASGSPRGLWIGRWRRAESLGAWGPRGARHWATIVALAPLLLIGGAVAIAAVTGVLRGHPSGLLAKLGAYRPVAARVVARSPTRWFARVTVDRGSSSGIQVNDPAVSGDGLAGKITTVSRNEAIVTLITDRTSGVSAKDLAGDASGVVVPATGDPSDLTMQFVQGGGRIQIGDTIATSGTAATAAGKVYSLFPPKIPIGRVTRVEAGPPVGRGVVHLTPFVDLRHLAAVQILTHISGHAGVRSSSSVPSAPGTSLRGRDDAVGGSARRGAAASRRVGRRGGFAGR